MCAVDGVELETVVLYTRNRRRGTSEHDSVTFYRSLLSHMVAGGRVVGHSAGEVSDFIA